MLTLKNMADVWPAFFYRNLDNYTTEESRKIEYDAMHGKLVEKTLHPDDQKQLPPRPLLFSVEDLPEVGSRCLVMYDLAGQVWTNQESVQDYAVALRQVTTTWLMVAVKDLESKDNDKTINELFNAYRSAMEAFRIDLRGLNLIVVYTKADEAQFPSDIHSYLGNDPFQWLTLRDPDKPEMPEFSFQTYMAEMQLISDQLREYTRRRVQGGRAFITMVEKCGMNLVFCATSALGESPNKELRRLQTNATRNRVLDPFLWAVALDTQREPPSISLILDASPLSQPVYAGSLIAAMSDILDNHGEVTTYYLGQQMAASIPGQPPPTSAPATARARLIGPILQATSPLARLLVVVTGPILDLDDFYDSPWRNRLVIVTLDEAYLSASPHHFVYRPGTDVRIFTTRLLSLFEEKM
jgi:hypothetical protein